MKDLLVKNEIDEACDLLKCLDMAFLDVELENRSPLETVLGTALASFSRPARPYATSDKTTGVANPRRKFARTAI